jgi:hypothetical protein
MYTEATVEELTSIVLLFKKAHFSGDVHTLDLTISKILAKESYKIKPFSYTSSRKAIRTIQFQRK